MAVIQPSSASEEATIPIASKLYNHPIYKHYAKVHEQHSEKNHISGNIEETLSANLTQRTLDGEQKIGMRSHSLFIIDDLFLSEFNDIDMLLADQSNQSYTFFHLGSQLSGHPNIVHGGLLATLLDEVTCRLAFQNIKSKKGVTANLNINYIKPCKTNSYVMIKCSIVKKSGRKCWVHGDVFDLDLEDTKFDPMEVESKSNLLTSCECLVIEPRMSI